MKTFTFYVLCNKILNKKKRKTTPNVMWAKLAESKQFRARMPTGCPQLHKWRSWNLDRGCHESEIKWIFLAFVGWVPGDSLRLNPLAWEATYSSNPVISKLIATYILTHLYPSWWQCTVVTLWYPSWWQSTVVTLLYPRWWQSTVVTLLYPSWWQSTVVTLWYPSWWQGQGILLAPAQLLCKATVRQIRTRLLSQLNY